MNFYALSALINMVTSLVLAGLVYFKGRKSIVSKTFSLFALSVTLWSFCYFFWQISTEALLALFWCRALMAGAILIPLTYLHHIVTLLNMEKEKKLLIVICYAISFLFLLTDFTPLLVVSVEPKLFFKFWPNPGIIYPLFLLMFFSCVVYGCYLMFKAYPHLTSLRRNQIKYVLLASIIGFAGGGTNYPLWYNIKIPPYGNFLVAFYTALLAYAIVTYRLMDINIAVTRASIFAVVYSLVLGLPFYLGYQTKSWIIATSLAVVLATTGPFIYSYFQRKAENRLRREEFEAHKALNRLSQNMMRVTKLDTLLKLIVHYVVKIMKVNFAAIYLKDEANKHYHLRATRSINKTSAEQSEFQEDSSLLKDILLRRVTIVSEELSFGRTSKVSPHLKRLQLELHKAKAAVVIPAFKGDYLFGFLLLGARENNRLFTQEDLNLLLLLANQAVLAIENAQLFEKEKVLLAEKSRRDALADMAPGVAHQFNNRLISISMVADTQFALNEEEDLNKLSPDKLKSLLEQSQKAFESISKDAIRGKDIADAILKKGRAKLAYLKADLAPIIQTAIELLKVSRTRKSLEGAPEPEVILNTEENLPQLILNESLIQDIFYNFIDNARDAIIIKNKAINENRITPDETPYKGKIIIKVFKENNQVIVTVQDNGIGMDEKAKSRLFVPYFTTKATSLKGTGMGLWVIRSFIEDHKGKISFESEYAKGTTFTISFPIKEV